MRHLWFRSAELEVAVLGVLVLTRAMAGLADISGGVVIHKDEVCHYEKLQVSCGETEVILMKKAMFGRMKQGKCVKEDFGYVGCSSDVLHILDNKCSGAQSCSFSVIEPNFPGLQPCNRELKSFLDVEYQCVTVPQAEDHSCSLAVTEKRFLPNAAGEDPLCGTSLSPWHIHAEQGQRIRIFLIDFLANPKYPEMLNVVPVSDACHRNYGEITDAARGRQQTLCGGQRREQEVYTSSTNSVRIEINYLESKNFLIYALALGCRKLRGDSRVAVMQQNAEHAKLQCRQSHFSWHLRCRANTWSGPDTNCSGKGLLFTQDIKLKTSPNSQLSAAVSAGIAVGVACAMTSVIVFAGIFCAKRLLGRSLGEPSADINFGGGSLECNRCEAFLVESESADVTHVHQPLYVTGRPSLVQSNLITPEPCYCLRQIPTDPAQEYQYGSTSLNPAQEYQYGSTSLNPAQEYQYGSTSLRDIYVEYSTKTFSSDDSISGK